jgi:hypothetical protein
VKQLESVEGAVPAFGDVDEKLGFALIALGRFNKDRGLVPTEAEGQIRRGCGYLVGYFERNPFGFSRESGTSPPIQARTGGGRGEMVLQALDDAVDIMGARSDELSRKQIEYLRILAHYRNKLSGRLWAGEA